MICLVIRGGSRVVRGSLFEVGHGILGRRAKEGERRRGRSARAVSIRRVARSTVGS